tara:strand:+ start:2095 stop:3759 length:1665 start_codon:yes stop_codon:yes gene_type:complete
MDNTEVLKKFNKLYEDAGYMSRYGTDVWITIIFLIVFLSAISYYNIKNNIEPIKADWANQRCNPGILFFSGLISKSDNETAFEATSNNFTFCIQTILANVASYAMQPYYYLTDMVTDEFNSITESVNAIRSMFDKIRNSVSDIGEDIMGRSLNITLPLVTLVINVMDMGRKIIGTLTASIYTIFGSYLGLQSVFLFLIENLVLFLSILATAVVVLWLASIWLPPLAATATLSTALFGALIVPTVVISNMMKDVMGLSGMPKTPKAPKKPKKLMKKLKKLKNAFCFAGNTIIKIKGKGKKYISDLKPDDILFDGSVVTGIMKLSAAKQEIYNLNGVLVTGNHSVLHENNGWISVERHPDSVRYNNYKEEYVYCINTDTKNIKIGKNIYSDWDDLDDNDLADLAENCCENTPLPKKFSKKDIHKYLDAGFDENTTIELEDGRSVSIKDIEVNDILRFGEYVTGIVEISCSDMTGIGEYNIYEGCTLNCTGNIQLQDLGNFNTFEIEPISIKKTERVYHLLTDRGSFIVNGTRVGDYNTSLEKYLKYCSPKYFYNEI